MNMNVMNTSSNKIFSTLSIMGFIIFLSCQPYNPGATNTVEMAGEFYVDFYKNDINTSPIHKNVLMQIHNTAKNIATDMWITSPYLKVRITSSNENLSYDATNATVEETTRGEKTPIKDALGATILSLSGQLFKKAAILKSGTEADSLFITFIGDKESNSTYYVAGTRRSGFSEDEP